MDWIRYLHSKVAAFIQTRHRSIDIFRSHFTQNSRFSLGTFFFFLFLLLLLDKIFGSSLFSIYLLNFSILQIIHKIYDLPIAWIKMWCMFIIILCHLRFFPSTFYLFRFLSWYFVSCIFASFSPYSPEKLIEHFFSISSLNCSKKLFHLPNTGACCAIDGGQLQKHEWNESKMKNNL